jgi:quercetin dioxygenase-like cupin family protein
MMLVLVPLLLMLTQPGFGSVRVWSPATIQWDQENPDGSKYAVLEGHRDVPGEPFTYAFFLPNGVWVSPHVHSEDARVTVISGTLLLGEGATMNQRSARSIAAGMFFVVPKNVPHWEGARGDTLIIGTAHGRWVTTPARQ